MSAVFVSHPAGRLALTKSIMVAVVTLALLPALGSHASVQPTTKQELRVQICSLATAGIETAASERQAGKSKEATHRRLDSDLQALRQQVKDDAFVGRIASAWYRGLEQVYQDPVLSTEEEKAEYIGTLSAAAIVSCLRAV